MDDLHDKTITELYDLVVQMAEIIKTQQELIEMMLSGDNDNAR